MNNRRDTHHGDDRRYRIGRPTGARSHCERCISVVGATAIQRLETTSNPIRDSRFAMKGLTAMVAGLIAVAVGNEHAIAHADEHVSAALSASLQGGPILFLLAQA
jgi:hypothetical protein